MKHLNLLFAIIVLLSCSITTIAQEKENNEKKTPYGIKLRRNDPPSTKGTRMPSNQYLEFFYFSDSGECQFLFINDIETLSINIVDAFTGFTYISEVTLENPVMYQALPASNYYITCISNGGDIFYGEFEIQ